jgi:lipopolysaccharide/colanic/teichoic acid biosynthesis glycosyltransferase
MAARHESLRGSLVKRSFDLSVAALGIVVLSPVLAVAALAVKLSSRGPVLFRQERMGRRFRPFRIYKFRTMVADAPALGKPITAGEDPRITRVGRWLRKMKIDELPQLFNVLVGDMSFVGPRPEVPKYVEMFRGDYEEILRVRPGITDPASIAYRDEAAILGRADDPERFYVDRVLPAKIRLAKAYAARASFWFDMAVIARTLAVVAVPRKVQRSIEE